jgi:hypothetical protein
LWWCVSALFFVCGNEVNLLCSLQGMELPPDYYDVSSYNSEDGTSSGSEPDSDDPLSLQVHILVRDLIRQERPRLDDHPMNVEWAIYEENLPLILLKVHQLRVDDAAIVDLCVHLPATESRYVYRQLAAIRAATIKDDSSDDEMPLDYEVSANLTELRRAHIEYWRFLQLHWEVRNCLGEVFGFLSRGEVYLCCPFGASGVGSATGDKHPFYLMRVMTWTMLPQEKRGNCLPIDHVFAYRLLPVVSGWSIDETISGERLSRVSEWLPLSWREERSSIYRMSIANIQAHVQMQCTGEDVRYIIAQDASNLDTVHSWGRYYGRMKMMPQFGAEDPFV